MSPADPAAISIQTAVLVIMAGALLFLAKALIELRTRVEEMERRPGPADSGGPPAASLPAATVPHPTEKVPPEVLAVIAAAVHVAHGGRARIVSVSPELDDLGWSREGRRQIFHSHKVR